MIAELIEIRSELARTSSSSGVAAREDDVGEEAGGGVSRGMSLITFTAAPSVLTGCEGGADAEAGAGEPPATTGATVG